MIEKFIEYKIKNKKLIYKTIRNFKVKFKFFLNMY